MTDQSKAVDEFIKFTCCSETEARNYLEAANWNTEAALVTYFDDRDDRFDPTTLGNAGPGGNTADRGSENDSMNADDDDFVDVDPPAAFENHSSPEKKKNEGSSSYKRPRSNIATFSTLQSNRDTEEDDDEQLYYAGGSEHSGQQIMGNDRRGDIAGEVFKHLKQMVTVGDVEVAGPSRERKPNFSGVGYRLGQTSDDTQVVGNTPRTGGQDERPMLHLRLWRDGFSVGDGPLRPYTDRENREIIEQIRNGEVPLELVPPGTTGGKVNVKVEDMRHSNFNGPVSRRNVFTGQGHVLGNVVPSVVVKTETSQETAAKPAEKPAAEQPTPTSPISVDDCAPSTNIAVRLPSGTRSQVRLNLSHTVQDLRTHLTTVHRELDGQTFVFMVNFPPKEVSDEKLTVSDAGMVNANVHLRIKKD